MNENAPIRRLIMERIWETRKERNDKEGTARKVENFINSIESRLSKTQSIISKVGQFREFRL